jgi:hypothetical protein
MSHLHALKAVVYDASKIRKAAMTTAAGAPGTGPDAAC